MQSPWRNFAVPVEEQVTALSPLGGAQVSGETAAAAAVARRPAGRSNAGSSKSYVKRFRDCWLLEESFKSWLLPVPDNPSRAKCKLCKVFLLAGKSELTKHAATRYHQAALRKLEGGDGAASSRPPPGSAAPSSSPSGGPAVVVPPLPAVHPLVQSRAPDFRGLAVVDDEIREVRLSDYEGKFLVLFFYPLDFSLAVPTELVEFSQRAAEFRNLNAAVVAVSTDSHCTHLAWTGTPRAWGGLGKVDVPLLSDFTRKISRAYGVLLEDEGFALKAIFIIDAKGMVRQVTVNDVCLRMSVGETLRLLNLLQHSDVRGAPIAACWAPDIDGVPEARTLGRSLGSTGSANNK